MSAAIGNSVDTYFEDRLVGEDEALAAANHDSAAAGLPPPTAVSATQRTIVHLMAISIGAKRILEVGAVGDYSPS